MTIEVISFLLGGILIATAIVGGGFEIKEIKMPRVGAGVRIVSLVVGSGFLMLGLGMWSVSNPHLLAEQATANALMAGAQTGAQTQPQAESQTRQATPVDVKTQSAEPAREQPAWAEPEAPREPGFTGFIGQADLTWTVDGVTYYGTANLSRNNGILHVSYFDPDTQTQSMVDQDLVLQEYEGTSWYVGSNPRESASQVALDQSRYMPDNLRVAAGSRGWTMDQVCSNGTCVSLSVQPRN